VRHSIRGNPGARSAAARIPWSNDARDPIASRSRSRRNRGFNTQRDKLDSPNTPGPVGDTGLSAANDEIVRLNRSPGDFPGIQAVGYKVVTWTVDDAPRIA
jgi:hypothetical protein